MRKKRGLFVFITILSFSLRLYAEDSPNKKDEVYSFGIAPGMMYVHCINFSENEYSYISGANGDSSGNINIKSDYRSINRVFPTITLLIRPFANSTTNYISKNFYYGLTLGVNEGVNNEGLGFACALGVSLGFSDNNRSHLGIFVGGVFDPTVRELSSKEFTHPTSGTVELHTKQKMGNYFAFGILYSLTI